jgi:uncharacterized small protein (DUF1192 family)
LIDAPAPVRQHCEALQAEVLSLRLDLAEATALIEALESEVWRTSARWRDPNDGRSAAGALDLMIQARTQLRRALSPRLESDEGRRAELLRDLRMAEAAFGFLLRLRAMRRAAAGR